jgi:hypothetical protein
MYGKIFASMYEGSMVGAGPLVFAVWGYCIAKADIDGTVLLNPDLLAPVIGTSTESIRHAVDFLQQPDEHSKNPDHDGRRLLHQSGHLYFVVSHEIYRAMKSNEDRREYMREYMRRKRAKEDVNSLRSLQDLTKVNPASVSVSDSAQERGCKGETKPAKPKPELAQPCFESPVFLKAWQDWQEHRREIKKPLTPRASQEQMKEFRAWGEVRAIKAIRHTIKKQWVGIREEDAQPNANKPQVYTCT